MPIPVPDPEWIVELTEIIAVTAPKFVTHYLTFIDVTLPTTAYCPFIIALILYQLDSGHHRIITFLSVTVPFALIPAQELFKKALGLNSALDVGLAPILAIFIACMAIFKNKLVMRPVVLMTFTSAVVWLISHCILYFIEANIIRPGFAEIHSSQYAWISTIDNSSSAALCANKAIVCSSGGAIDTQSYQTEMLGIGAYPLAIASSLVSMVWLLGLFLVMFFHRRKQHV